MKTRTILTADDLSVGQCVTIHSGSRIPCGCGCGGTERFARIKGMPLQVRAINLPYVAATLGEDRGPLVVLDLRECDLAGVSEEYAAAFRSGTVADV